MADQTLSDIRRDVPKGRLEPTPLATATRASAKVVTRAMERATHSGVGFRAAFQGCMSRYQLLVAVSSAQPARVPGMLPMRVDMSGASEWQHEDDAPHISDVVPSC
mmetsp:Transcript_20691/g.55357  ORF Transcript_20691/g.55357 Transcript_20691/m.55357 type:complete len:106 (-) Transcript_20691:166-483(-)